MLSALLESLDHGAVSREFLDNAWRQMGTLSIHVNGIQVRLFDSKGVTVVPLSDLRLRRDVAKSFKIKEDGLDQLAEAVKALDQVWVCYRAIGRLMIHSLASGHVLPYHVMPRFYRHVSVQFEDAGEPDCLTDFLSTDFFCDCRPGDGYSHAAVKHQAVLLSHIQQLGFASFHIFKYHNDGEIEDADPNQFLRVIDDQMLEGESMALSSILDGLVLAAGPVKTAAQRIAFCSRHRLADLLF